MKDLFQLARHSVAGLLTLLLLTVVLGLGYPLAVTGIAAVAMPWQANGSLVDASGQHTTDPSRAVGSALLGQASDRAALFVPRPSAAGDGYDPLASAGSNLGPDNEDLVATIKERRAEIAQREGVDPADAVTASASGLDPDISPAYAALQVPRVARANGLSEEKVRELVADHTDGRTIGVLGEPRVDVLMLNVAVREPFALGGVRFVPAPIAAAEIGTTIEAALAGKPEDQRVAEAEFLRQSVAEALAGPVSIASVSVEASKQQAPELARDRMSGVVNLLRSFTNFLFRPDASAHIGIQGSIPVYVGGITPASSAAAFRSERPAMSD